MSDRELLEAAARAAGIELTDYCTKVAICFYNRRTQAPWNPLTDDGDALRLAVKLGIELYDSHQYGKACAYLRNPMLEFWENIGTDPYAATRRAIVRAAAALEGKP